MVHVRRRVCSQDGKKQGNQLISLGSVHAAFRGGHQAEGPCSAVAVQPQQTAGSSDVRTEPRVHNMGLGCQGAFARGDPCARDSTLPERRNSPRLLR